MENKAVLVGILLVAVIGVSYQEMQPSDEVKDTMINCMKEQGMSEGEQMEAMKKKSLTNEKERCITHCVMAKFGIFDGDRIIDEISIEAMKSFHQDISHGSIKKIHELCTSEAQKKNDKCDRAEEYKICFMKMIE